MRLGKVGGRLRKPRWSGIVRSQRGQVLIEVLVALAIFGVVAVGFLTALTTGYQGIVFSHNKTMAESLTRTTLEEISKAEFPVSGSVTTVSAYDVVVHADNVTKDSTDAYIVTSGPSDIQLITVEIANHKTGRTIMTTQNIKVR